MARLPISRIVDVSLLRQDQFATRTGFGVPLIMTSETSATGASSTVRTKVYGTMDEVVADYLSTTEAYKAALAVFSQNPKPKQIKIGFFAAGALTGSPTMTAELDAVHAFDRDWYWLLFVKSVRDTAAQQLAIVWADAKRIIYFAESNAVGTEDPANTTVVAAVNKGIRERTALFYHTDSNVYLAPAAVGYTATRNFDELNSAYTLKFKSVIGVPVVDRASAAVQGVTGFVPGLGLSAIAGHNTNTYVNIGGVNMIVEGSTLGGDFIDEIHTSDWVVARTEEEILSLFATQDRVPMTDQGIEQIVACVRAVMNRASIAGLIEADISGPNGTVSAYQIEVERVSAVPQSQRRDRIAPAILCRFRYNGAVHYSTIRYTMTF